MGDRLLDSARVVASSRAMKRELCNMYKWMGGSKTQWKEEADEGTLDLQRWKGSESWIGVEQIEIEMVEGSDGNEATGQAEVDRVRPWWGPSDNRKRGSFPNATSAPNASLSVGLISPQMLLPRTIRSGHSSSSCYFIERTFTFSFSNMVPGSHSSCFSLHRCFQVPCRRTSVVQIPFQAGSTRWRPLTWQLNNPYHSRKIFGTRVATTEYVP